MPSMLSTRRALTGWGRTAPSVAQLVAGATEADLRRLVADAGPRGVIARGLGRSYGAPAQNAGGVVVAMADDRPEIVATAELDPLSQTVTAPAGASLDALLRWLVPSGWFVPVTPGTRRVTLGGAVAADIHGKNHHVDGSFGHHVVALRLLLADGTTLRVSPQEHAELFWATIGGMGLTGVILEVTFKVLPITTSRIRVDTERCGNLEELCAAMSGSDDAYRYSVAWIDLLAKGRHLGRSVLTRGDHADLEDLGGGRDPLAYRPRVVAAVPPMVPDGLLNGWSIRAFNEWWYRRAPRRRTTTVESIGSFFHPLDSVASWNRLYGRAGFVQYQFVVPLEADGVLRRVVERLARSGTPSFLAVLKRFGPANQAPLSFPMPGWTLALDLPAGVPEVPRMLAELDDAVLGAGGRHYLAKDAHLTAAGLRRGYPRFDDWKRVRDKADPSGTWNSDLARRLGMVG